MCAPCKIIINDGAEAAASGMTLLTQQIVASVANGTMSKTAGDALMLKMASAEATFVRSCREARLEFAKNVSTSSQEWLDLMSQI